ncbi:hypothetical protein G7046_g3701 [Stylonectria norvegica]|nr:hypothetical protein G7046_g3701 [Stylonectria norvegica]
MPQDGAPTSEHHDDRESESWTYVKPKARGKRGKIRLNLPIDLPEQPPRTKPLRSVEDIDAEFRKTRAGFETETCCKMLRKMVAAHAIPTRPISRAINLGIGTFDPRRDTSEVAKRCSFVQLVAFLIMVEELEALTKQDIKCVFQDPAFAQSDKDFLASLGHEVVETPAGCDMVDADSFIFAVHLYRPIYAMALERHSPAIYVGTGWEVWERIVSLGIDDGDDMKPMRIMDETYGKSMVPQHSRSWAFSSTCIYWRPDTCGHVPKEKPAETSEGIKKAPKGEKKKGEETSQGEKESIKDESEKGGKTAEDEIVEKLKSTTIA